MKIIALTLRRIFEEIQEIPEEEFTPLKVQTILVAHMKKQSE